MSTARHTDMFRGTKEQLNIAGSILAATLQSIGGPIKRHSIHHFCPPMSSRCLLLTSPQLSNRFRQILDLVTPFEGILLNAQMLASSQLEMCVQLQHYHASGRCSADVSRNVSGKFGLLGSMGVASAIRMDGRRLMGIN